MKMDMNNKKTDTIFRSVVNKLFAAMSASRTRLRHFICIYSDNKRYTNVPIYSSILHVFDAPIEKNRKMVGVNECLPDAQRVSGILRMPDFHEMRIDCREICPSCSKSKYLFFYIIIAQIFDPRLDRPGLGMSVLIARIKFRAISTEIVRQLLSATDLTQIVLL